MKAHFQFTGIALLLGVTGVAQAALTMTSGTVSFNGSASVTASQSYPNTPGGTGPLNVTNTNNGATAASIGLGKFDAANGVLISVDLQLASIRTQIISGSGYKNNGAAKTMSGNGSSTAALVASGANLSFAPAIAQTGGSCALAAGGTGSINCSWGPTPSSATTTNGSTGVNSANLNDYVGSTGTVNASLSLPSLSATDTQSTNQGQASGSSATYQVNWTGSVQANYSYLLHALASFDGNSASNTLTLDFGNVLQNSNAVLNFGLFNLADPNRIGLDLDSVVGSGNTSAFNTNLSPFADLAQGSGQSFIANLLTANTGAFSAQYQLNLSDADFGANSTWQNHQLTLTLIGNVSAVPVPGAVWLFGSAMAGLIGVGRRNCAGLKVFTIV